MQSPDGYFIVDYLHMIYEECMEPMEELKRHKNAIIKTVQQNKNNIKVIEKYRWLSEYHNYKFNEAFNPEEWEENYSAELIKDYNGPGFSDQKGCINKVYSLE